MTNEGEDFECVIPKADFEQLRDDWQFIRMLQLARFQNQLSFCLAAGPEIKDVDRPSYYESRQLINALLFGSAILFEGLGQLREAMSHFKWYLSYKADFRPFIKDKDTHRLRERYLEQLRNKAVSHVDADRIADTLKWVTYDEYILLGGGPRTNTIYYPLADNVAFTASMGPHDSDNAEMQTIIDYLELWQKVTVRFNAVVNKVLLEYIEKKGWNIRPREFAMRSIGIIPDKP